MNHSSLEMFECQYGKFGVSVYGGDQSNRRSSGETMFAPMLLTHFSNAERNSAVSCPTFADIMREGAENTEIL